MPPPRGGGALLRNLNDNYAHSGALNGTENLTPQEQLLAGTLELDPENDPVIGTTEGGVEIRFHNKALLGTWDYEAFIKDYVGTTNGSTYGASTITSLSGYFYVRLGGYNWIIIGRNSDVSWTNITYTNTYDQNTEQISNFIKFADYSTYANALKSQVETSTDAGVALDSANVNGIINTVSGISRSYSINFEAYESPVVPTNGEIPSGCVLCLCEGTVGNGGFGIRRYPGSNIDTTLTNLYESIKEEANNQIQLTTLKTWGYTTESSSGTYASFSHDEYLFLLSKNYSSSYSENFALSTYLTSEKSYISNYWWLRTVKKNTGTYYAYCVPATSLGNSYDPLSTKHYFRPVFVLKL